MRLRLQCVYRPQLAGGVGRACGETFPVRLHVFGTHELRRERPDAHLFGSERLDEARQSLNADDDGFWFDTSIEWRGVAREEDVYAPMRALGAYTFADVNRLFEPYKISRSARVVFNAYAKSLNPERQACWVRVGSASFCVAEIEQLLAGGSQMTYALVQNAVDYVSSRPHPDVLRDDAPLIKGRVTIVSASLDGGTLDDFKQSLLAIQPDFDMGSVAEMRRAALEMTKAINRVMATFFGPNAALPSPSIAPLIRFHAVVTLKDQLVVASLGYCTNAAPRPPPFAFFARCMRAVCWRRNLSVDDLNATAEALFGTSNRMPTRARALAFYSFSIAVLTMLALSLVYIEDFANKNVAGRDWSDTLVEGDEDHKIARTELGDDCEGLALEIYMLALDLFFSGNDIIADARNEPEPLVRLLRNVVRVLRLYVPGMKFGAVTNAKLTYGGSSTMTRDNTLAHTYTCFIPFDKFIALQSPDVVRQLTQSRHYGAYAEQRVLMERLDLPVLVGEGTANVDAWMRPIDLAYADDPQSLEIAASLCARKASLLERIHASLDGTRAQIEIYALDRYSNQHSANQRDVSDFYKWSNGFTTAIFADTLMLDFAFYYRNRGPSMPERTYGVTFNDLLLKTSSDETERQVRMMPTTTLTRREAAVMDNVMALDEVVPRVDVDQRVDELPIPRALIGLARSIHAPSPSTALHQSRIVVSLRVADVGDVEVSRLNDLAVTEDWAAIELRAYRLATIAMENVDPIDVVDIVFRF